MARPKEPEKAAIQHGYDRWAEIYDREENPLNGLEEPVVREALGDVAGLAVLDLGCGTGRHTLWLAARGASVTAVDFSEGMMEKARAKPGASAVHFLVHDLHQPLPFGAAAFDRIVSGLVLEHLSDLAAVFAEARRVLRPGGRAVVSAMHPAMFLKVPAHADFEVLVVADESGFDFLEVVDAALSSLIRRLDRGDPVHLVLPNPDLIFPRGPDRFGIAAGSVAMLFESALDLRYPDRPRLRFARLGKPHAPIYEEGLRRCGTTNAVMIGDTLNTDIRGANACGIDSVLLHTGVTRPQVSTADGVRPTCLMRSLLA